jgi:1,2-diacylglycerol 3-beta-glucosyltransferase
MILALGHRVDLVLVLAVTLVLLSLVYGLVLLVLSRRPLRHELRPTCPAERTVVFVLPCLNEEQVLRPGLEARLALDHPRMQVVVVDDGSDDGTAAIAETFPDPRVHLVRRHLPQARLGKGEALNAALAPLVEGSLALPDPDDVVVAVVDADGRLDPDTLQVVLPFFDDPAVGGVQVGVRISNRRSGFLARMQDVEFVLYTEVFQRGRRHLGSVGLGGNGQFVRLSSLLGLGPAPWTRCLTEDLDLGVRLLLGGWRLEFTPAVNVHQQGLTDVRRWLRQRTRWFQGHLQSWHLVPTVLARLPGWTRADVYYHLTASFLLLVASVLSAAFALWLAGIAVSVLAGTVEASWWWLSAYLVAVGPAVVFGAVYHAREREAGLSVAAAVLLMHGYVAYAVLWYVAAWRAVGRVVRGRTAWAKTDRVDEPSTPGGRPPEVTVP